MFQILMVVFFPEFNLLSICVVGTGLLNFIQTSVGLQRVSQPFI
jgi:hypothetical protein